MKIYIIYGQQQKSHTDTDPNRGKNSRVETKSICRNEVFFIKKFVHNLRFFKPRQQQMRRKLFLVPFGSVFLFFVSWFGQAPH